MFEGSKTAYLKYQHLKTLGATEWVTYLSHFAGCVPNTEKEPFYSHRLHNRTDITVRSLKGAKEGSGVANEECYA